MGSEGGCGNYTGSTPLTWEEKIFCIGILMKRTGNTG